MGAWRWVAVVGRALFRAHRICAMIWSLFEGLRMSFEIFASGTGHFHFRRHCADFGDVYSLADALSAVASPPDSVRAVAEGAAADAVAPDNPLQRLLNMMGQSDGVRVLTEAVDMAVAEKRPLHVTTSLRRSATLWTDATATETTLLDSTSMEAGREYLLDIQRALEATEFNGFGVLAAIAEVFANFGLSGRRGSDRMYRLLIQISA